MADAAAIRAGEAYVEITARDQQLQQGLQKIGAKLQSWGQSLALAGAGLFGGFAAAVRVSEFADTLSKLSIKTGIAVETLSAWRYAAQLTGIEIGDIQAVHVKLTQALQGASEESGRVSEGFRQLGLSAQEFLALTPERRMLALARALRGIPDPTQRAAAAMQLLGRNALQLMPFFLQLEDLTERALQRGFLLTAEHAARYEAVQDAISEVQMKLQQIAVGVAQSILPTLQSLADTMATMGTAISKWISEHQKLFDLLFRISGILLAVGGGMVALSKILSGVAGAFAGLTKALAVAIAFVKQLWAAILAHPVLAFTIVLAVLSVTAAVQALNAAMAGTGPTLDALERRRQVLEESYASAQKQLEALAVMSQTARLSASEQDRAANIVEHLNRHYGDLGITLDKTTGRLYGVAAAQAKLNEEQRRHRAGLASTETVQLRQRLAQITRELEYRGEGRYAGYRDIMAATFGRIFPEILVGLERYTGQELRAMALQIRQRIPELEAAQRDLLGAATSGVPAPEPLDMEALLQAQKRIRDARIALMEDEIARARATQLAWYQEQVQKYAGSTAMLERIAEEHALRMERIRRDHQRRLEAARHQADLAELNLIRDRWQRERAITEKQYTERLRTAGEDRELRAEILRERQAALAAITLQQQEEFRERWRRLREQIEDVQIELRFEGLEKEIARLQAEFRREWERLSKEGATPAELQALQELYRLRIALAQQDAKKMEVAQELPEQPEPERLRITATGTFNPLAAFGLGASGGYWARTAVAAEEIAKNVKRLAQKAQGQPVFI